jgi:hypothetical protein
MPAAQAGVLGGPGRAQDVILVAVAGRDAWGHGGLVITQTMTVQKGLVHQALGDQHMGQSAHQGRVGAGPDGYPFIRESGDGVGVPWIDHDDAHPAFLFGHYQVADGAAAAHAGFGRVVAKEDRQLAVDQIADVVAGLFISP